MPTKRNSHHSGVTLSAEQHLTPEELIERAVDEARKLPDYTSNDEESTARHEIPQNIHFDVHLTQPSSPEIQVEGNATFELGPVRIKGLPRWLIALLGLLAAGGTALLSYLLSKR